MTTTTTQKLDEEDRRARCLLAAGQITMLVSLVTAEEFEAASRNEQLLPSWQEALRSIARFRRDIDGMLSPSPIPVGDPERPASTGRGA